MNATSPIHRKYVYILIATASCLLRSFATDAIDVSNTVYPVKQPTRMSCWAAATTILYSWKTQQSFEIETVVAKAGPGYVVIYKKDLGISPADEIAFYEAVGLTVIKQQNLTVKAWADLLKGGPISVTVDADPGKGFIHALVVYSMSGDGSSENTIVGYIDPADGEEHTVSFAAFLKLYEGSASWPLQIIHW